MPKIKVTSHRGFVIIDASEMQDGTPGWTPVGGGRIGSVSDARHVALSRAAYGLLCLVPRGDDDIGDVMWWGTCDAAHFGWLGGDCHILGPDAVGDRNYAPRGDVGDFIPNEPPPEAAEMIDAYLDGSE